MEAHHVVGHDRQKNPPSSSTQKWLSVFSSGHTVHFFFFVFCVTAFEVVIECVYLVTARSVFCHIPQWRKKHFPFNGRHRLLELRQTESATSVCGTLCNSWVLKFCVPCLMYQLLCSVVCHIRHKFPRIMTVTRT